VFDQKESEDDDELYREWQDKIVRESLANSCLVKVRHVSKKLFFGRGKLHSLAEFLRITPFDCLFINAELSPSQVKNLKKAIEARLNDISLASAYPSRDPFDSDTDFETEDVSPLIARRNQSSYRRINVFDRFAIILQIFAARSSSLLTQLLPNWPDSRWSSPSSPTFAPVWFARVTPT
jgi:50S ribosomal subunit-associated GTPase HflX